MSFDIEPGALNKQLTIQVRGTGKDAAGGQVTTWTDVVTVWAAIRPPTSAIMRSAREVFVAGARRDAVLHEIVVRYGLTITGAHRGKIGARIFDLGMPIDPDEQHEWLVIPATEGLNNG
jgi:SPP1 family predicted phage head-tail adaptor